MLIGWRNLHQQFDTFELNRSLEDKVPPMDRQTLGII